MKRFFCIIFTGLLTMSYYVAYAKTLDIKVGTVTDSAFFEKLEILLRSEKFAPDENIKITGFFVFDTTDINPPKSDRDYFENYERLKTFKSGDLPNDYYFMVSREPEYINKNYQGYEMVMVKYAGKIYFLPAYMNNILFRIYGEKRVRQVNMSKERYLEILKKNFFFMPVIHVVNYEMSYLDESHPIYLILHE